MRNFAILSEGTSLSIGEHLNWLDNHLARLDKQALLLSPNHVEALAKAKQDTQRIQLSESNLEITKMAQKLSELASGELSIAVPGIGKVHQALRISALSVIKTMSECLETYFDHNSVTELTEAMKKRKVLERIRKRCSSQEYDPTIDTPSATPVVEEENALPLNIVALADQENAVLSGSHAADSPSNEKLNLDGCRARLEIPRIHAPEISLDMIREVEDRLRHSLDTEELARDEIRELQAQNVLLLSNIIRIQESLNLTSLQLQDQIGLNEVIAKAESELWEQSLGLESQFEEAKAQSRRFTRSVMELSEALDCERGIVTERDKKCEALQVELDAVLAVMIQKNKADSAKYSTLTGDFESLQSSWKKSNDKLADGGEKTKVLQHQLEVLQVSFAETNKGEAAEARVLRLEVRSLQTSLEESNKQVKREEEKCKALQEKLDALRAGMKESNIPKIERSDTLLKEIKSLKEALRASKVMASEFMHSKETSEVKVRRLSTDKKNLVVDIASLRIENESLMDEKRASSTALDNAKAQVEKLERDLKLQEPLYKVGVACRLRFVREVGEIWDPVFGLRTESAELAIEGGIRATRMANIHADTSLFKLGLLVNENAQDLASFRRIYGYPHQYLSKFDHISSVVQVQEMNATLAYFLRDGIQGTSNYTQRWKELVDEYKTLVAGWKKPEGGYDWMQAFDLSKDCQDKLAELKELFEMIFNAAEL